MNKYERLLDLYSLEEILERADIEEWQCLEYLHNYGVLDLKLFTETLDERFSSECDDGSVDDFDFDDGDGL